MFRLSPKEQAEVKRQLAVLLEKEDIHPSCSPFGASILFVTTKDGSLRMCVDYRSLDKHTIKKRYPISCIDDVLDRLEGARCFSSSDLQQEYHQTRLHLSDVPTMAFRIAEGLFDSNLLPCVLTNAHATFQTLIYDVLHGDGPALKSSTWTTLWCSARHWLSRSLSGKSCRS